MRRINRWTWIALAAGLGMVSASPGCDADLRDIQGDLCVLQLDGSCDEPEICAPGTDLADCHEGPYGACHTFSGNIAASRCASGDECVFDPNIPVDWSVCSELCETDADCPSAPPGGNNTDPVCQELILPITPGPDGLPTVCTLPCGNAGQRCPDGMTCTPDRICAWKTEELF